MMTLNMFVMVIPTVGTPQAFVERVGIFHGCVTAYIQTRARVAS